MNISHSALFHPNTNVCLIYFGQDYRDKTTRYLYENSNVSTLTYQKCNERKSVNKYVTRINIR